MSKGAARIYDICTGHRGISPRPNNQGSPDTFINNRAVHRQSDSWPVHRSPKVHKSFLAAGSTLVYVNGLQQGRIGDPVACGSKVATGSTDVFVGDVPSGLGGGGGSSGQSTAAGPAPSPAAPARAPQEQEDPTEDPQDTDEPVEEIDSECNRPVKVYYTPGFSGRTRNKPIQPRLYSILQSAAAAACVDVEIFSGGQDPPGPGARRTGSRRHDNGYAADVYLHYEGRVLTSRSSNDLPIISKFIRSGFAAGATAAGMGNGYMNNTGLHIDIAAGQPGVNAARVWGGPNASRANAPSWLVSIA